MFLYICISFLCFSMYTPKYVIRYPFTPRCFLWKLYKFPMFFPKFLGYPLCLYKVLLTLYSSRCFYIVFNYVFCFLHTVHKFICFSKQKDTNDHNFNDYFLATTSCCLHRAFPMNNVFLKEWLFYQITFDRATLLRVWPCVFYSS